ncbi:hypothetical protein C4J99_3479 [Pseudomonas synxantha]|nr:hypothetical protein C4J99_3479 [Pseudomonas synxantha]
MQSNCGRGLARDGGGSVNTSATDPLQSGASPLPHWIDGVFESGARQCRYYLHRVGASSLGPLKAKVEMQSNCGRGLAPDGGGSVNTSATDPLQSGASPLPTLDRWCI